MFALTCMTIQDIEYIYEAASVYAALTGIMVNTLPFPTVSFPLGEQS